MVVGVLEMPVDRTPIDSGTYWIMAVYDIEASVGMQYVGSGGFYKFRSLSYSAPMPDPFGATDTEAGPVFNYYIVGY
jgi:hypothetical protein